jgi:AraC-like DNA-binding protein
VLDRLDDAKVQSQDSPLGRWTVGRWFPPRASRLFGTVDHIWYFDGTMTHAKERVFPDGRAELIVMLDEPHRDGDAERHAAFPAVCINGLRTRPSVVVAPAGRCRVLGIRFGALGAGLLLRASMTELVDVTIDVRDAVGRAAEELGERCAGAANAFDFDPARGAVAVLRVAAEWTTQQIRPNLNGNAEIGWMLDAIRQARGIVSVDALASQMGMLRTHLTRRFHDRVGVSPKRFARIVRFHDALSQLGRGGSIAATAADLAYYDQAHMYRDFAEFAGMTPGEFIAANRYPGSPSLAES